MPRSALGATYSTSNAPGVSSAGRPPCAGAAYKWVQPSFSHGNTSRSPAAHTSWPSATTPRNALPVPVSARQTSRPVPVPTSAIRMDQGSAVRRGVNGTLVAAGVRMNATRRPSGPQTGSSSESTLGSRNRSILAATSYTAMKLWSPRSLTTASCDPSGDQRSALIVPRALNSCSAAEESTIDADQTCPRLTNATRSPLGDTAGEWPSPIRRGGPPVAATTQTACSTPATALCGFGYSPLRFAAPPRTYTIAFASGAQRRSVISWPSSSV